MKRALQSLKRRTTRARACRIQLESLESRRLLSGTTFDITGVNPANGSVVSSLPNGQVVITLSETVAGLSDGQSPIQTSGGFNAYDVMLIPQGPSGVFSAPSGVNGGSLPIHANVVYHVNGNGTSEFVLTPTQPLSTDVYAVHVDLSAFKDGSGNTLTDNSNGYSTFLLQLPAVNANQPLEVTGVTAFNGQVAINNNVVAMPDTIQIHFNKPLFAQAAGNNNVQLIANPGPNFSVVPSVAAYSPSTDSIYLTPTAALNPNTLYVIRVAGKDSGSTYVSDDQGYGHAGYPLNQTFYDSFEVNASTYNPSNTFTVGSILPTPSTEVSHSFGYVSAELNKALDVNSLSRYSVMVVPQSGGLNTSAFDAADVPLNATVAYNPNTGQIITVPSQPVGNDIYLVALGSMTSGGAPLLNNAGQPAGVEGNAPYYATFAVNANASASTSAAAPSVIVATIPDGSGTSTTHRSQTA